MTNVPSSDICKQVLKVTGHRKALRRARRKARETWTTLVRWVWEDEKCVFTAGNWTEAGGNIRRVSRRSDLRAAPQSCEGLTFPGSQELSVMASEFVFPDVFNLHKRVKQPPETLW